MHARLQGLMQAGRFPKLNVFIIIIIITLIIAVLYRELALNGKKKERKTRVTQNNNEITIQLFLNRWSGDHPWSLGGFQVVPQLNGR